MMKFARFQSFIQRQMPATLELLRRMVEINSYTSNPAGVNELGRLTADAFGLLGFSSKFIDSVNPQFGQHLLLNRAGNGPQNLALISHLDTVFSPEEEERNDFKWRRDGDRIYGPGTHDIKGGTALMWLTLSTIRELEPEAFDKITWKVFFNSSEERLSHDFGSVCRAHFDPQTMAALVFESEGRLGTEGRVVVARKGRGTWRISVEGRSAHAGARHAQGANAIVQLAQVLDQVSNMTDYSKDLTVNVGFVRGGTELNRVPHHAYAEGEFRAFDQKAYREIKSAILAINGPGVIASPSDGYTCKLRSEILSETPPWPRNGQTDWLAKIWCETAADLQMSLGVEERGGLSDGNLIWDAVPTLDGLGPWGDNDHCSEFSRDGSKVPEFVSVSSIPPKALLNTMAILTLIQNR